MLEKYFVADEPTPIFNTCRLYEVFGGNQGSLVFDEQNLVRALEMIALPLTVFKVIDQKSSDVFEVKTKEYQAPYPLFIDKRFGSFKEEVCGERKKLLPSKSVIIQRLKDALGLPYIWGGNIGGGISKMLGYYPPPKGKVLSSLERDSWSFSGVDCSGLLYEATNGCTPRNTSELLFFGEKVQGDIKSLKALDLIVYSGHLMIVIGPNEMVESNLEKGGVVSCSLTERLEELFAEGRRPSHDPFKAKGNDKLFLIRRGFFI